MVFHPQNITYIIVTPREPRIPNFMCLSFSSKLCPQITDYTFSFSLSTPYIICVI